MNIDDPITTEPTEIGSYGRAWHVNLPALLKKRELDPARDAGIDLWLVEAPRAHPVWHSYMLLMMHMQPIAGVDDPICYLPGATHEFGLWAVSPDAKRQEILDNGEWVKWALQPGNFAAQIIATDDEAKVRLLTSVRDILCGYISPDTDYIRSWAHLWGDNMLKKD